MAVTFTTAHNRKENKLDINQVAIADNLVFSKTDVWAYYRIANRAFDYLSTSGKIEIMRTTSAAFSLLGIDKGKEYPEFHTISDIFPVDATDLINQTEELIPDQNYTPRPGYNKYLNEQTRAINKTNTHVSQFTYVGVHLGKRSILSKRSINPARGLFGIIKDFFLEAYLGIKEAISAVGEKANLKKVKVSEREERLFRTIESQIHRNIKSSDLKGMKCSSEEILLVTKKTARTHNMPEQWLTSTYGDVIGAGDILNELDLPIFNRDSWRVIRLQEIGPDGKSYEGYRACLTFRSFDKITSTANQEPFLYVAKASGKAFTAWTRFKLVSPEKVQGILAKKRREHRDELEGATVGRDSYDMILGDAASDEVMDAIQDSQTMTRIIANDDDPWVDGQYHIVVEGTTFEEVTTEATELISYFHSRGIKLHWSYAAQARLMLSQMPGDRMRDEAFNQFTTLGMIGFSGFNLAGEVGNPVYGRGAIDINHADDEEDAAISDYDDATTVTAG